MRELDGCSSCASTLGVNFASAQDNSDEVGILVFFTVVPRETFVSSWSLDTTYLDFKSFSRSTMATASWRFKLKLATFPDVYFRGC